jgi:hypothetical protein
MGALATPNALEIHKKSLSFLLYPSFPTVYSPLLMHWQTSIKPHKMGVFALRKLR